MRTFMNRLFRICASLLFILLLVHCSSPSVRDQGTVTDHPPDLGDIIVRQGDQIENAEAYRQWIRNLEQRVPSGIRIIAYTTEGDPIYYTLNYNGKEIEYTFDNSADAFAGPDKGKKRAVCQKLVQRTADSQLEYRLEQCRSEPDDNGAEIGETFYFRLPKE